MPTSRHVHAVSSRSVEPLAVFVTLAGVRSSSRPTQTLALDNDQCTVGNCTTVTLSRFMRTCLQPGE